MVRTLEPAPRSLAGGGAPHFGSFAGGLPKLELGPTGRSALWNLAHAKRWTYAAVADESVFAAAAVVRLGYASTALAFALDRRTGRMLFDRSVMGPPTAATFTDDGAGRRSGRFRWGPAGFDLGDARVTVDFKGRSPFHIGVRAGVPSAPPISAVVPIVDGYASATEKRIADAEGEVVAEGKRFLLSRATVGLDHTAGFLARHTEWRWAFGFGYAGDPAVKVGFNLVAGFVGEGECAAWVGEKLVPLGEGRFTYGDPRSPWRVTTSCGALDVLFRPSAMHSEEKNLLVARSHFVQPVGAFEGTLRVGNRTIELKNIPGVTEHQDVLW
jgi:hypothetical protein